MTDHRIEDDNHRLRLALRRVIAEREIAFKALMILAFDEITTREASTTAETALDDMLGVPFADGARR